MIVVGVCMGNAYGANFMPEFHEKSEMCACCALPVIGLSELYEYNSKVMRWTATWLTVLIALFVVLIQSEIILEKVDRGCNSLQMGNGSVKWNQFIR